MAKATNRHTTQRARAIDALLKQRRARRPITVKQFREARLAGRSGVVGIRSENVN